MDAPRTIFAFAAISQIKVQLQKWKITVLDCEKKDTRPSFKNMSEILKNFIKPNDKEYCSRDHNIVHPICISGGN